MLETKSNVALVKKVLFLMKYWIFVITELLYLIPYDDEPVDVQKTIIIDILDVDEIDDDLERLDVIENEYVNIELVDNLEIILDDEGEVDEN